MTEENKEKETPQEDVNKKSYQKTFCKNKEKVLS